MNSGFALSMPTSETRAIACFTRATASSLVAYSPAETGPTRGDGAEPHDRGDEMAGTSSANSCAVQTPIVRTVVLNPG